MSTVNFEEFKYHKEMLEKAPSIIKIIDDYNGKLYVYKSNPTVRDLIVSGLELKLHFEKLKHQAERYMREQRSNN